MSTNWQPFAFSVEPWYRDPADHRCPYDAWLDCVELREPSTGPGSDQRQTTITIKLLGAHHDGWITFHYVGVRSHALTSYLCDQGMGDWLRDEFGRSEAGLTAHRITWRIGPNRTNQWLIEAREITYEWRPKA
ncbi:MAG: hypothetical protein NTV51_24895 [Verrucomicrobia bacterium]|nr:hypothetical protein [Verrucomicrobiota bacterium]